MKCGDYMKYTELMKNGVYGDVKLFHFDTELLQYLNETDLTPYDNNIIHNDVEYIPHYLIFNIVHDSCIYGVVYRPRDGKHDILFGVVGCKLDTVNNGIVNDFDALYDMLTDSYYYID